jgi:hypothetical protein
MRRTSVLAALSMSLFIYMFYRTERTVVNELMILLLSYDSYFTMKGVVAGMLPLNEIMIYSLPGGLWVFAATSLSRGFYVKAWDEKMQIAFAPVIFAILLEFCQLIHLTPGRFDLWDIAFYLAFWLLANMKLRTDTAEEAELTPLTLHGFVCLACFLSVFLAHVSQ